MNSGLKIMCVQRLVLPYVLLLFGLFGSDLLWPGHISALCTSMNMEGDWVNVEPAGALKRIELRFKCCDQVHCPVGQPCVTVCNPDKDSVSINGPCAEGYCNWGTVVPDYIFMDENAGYQTTRVDAQFKVGNDIRRIVILLLGNDQLIAHWSIDYPNGSGQKDFSLIEYFERERCFTFMGRTFCQSWAVPKYDLFERRLPKIIKK